MVLGKEEWGAGSLMLCVHQPGSVPISPRVGPCSARAVLWEGTSA